jgi:hypothetical protein
MGHGIFSNRTGPPANGVGKKNETMDWGCSGKRGPRWTKICPFDELTTPIANDTELQSGRTLYLDSWAYLRPNI